MYLYTHIHTYHDCGQIPYFPKLAMATKHVLFLLILLLVFLCIPTSRSIEFSYPAFFNFGDSNSDTGNLIAGLGGSLAPPDGKTYFNKTTGRFCDGRLIIDFLMQAMRLPLLNAYLDSVGAPSFKQGCNFAAAGSTIHEATATSISPFSFGVQVGQFFRLKARALDLLSHDKKLEDYLPQEDYFQKGLYMFDIGQNDLAGAFYTRTLDQVLATIPTYLSQFEDGIKYLYDQGGRNFWIHNTGPLGCLPQIIANFGSYSSSRDEFGCVRTHNQAAKAFNDQLYTLCRRLQDKYRDANITYIDIQAIKLDLIANYSQHGFEQPTMACCGYGGPPLNYDSRVGCGSTVLINGTSFTSTPCNDSSKFVNWDGIHYTEAANQYVASQILTRKYFFLREDAFSSET